MSPGIILQLLAERSNLQRRLSTTQYFGMMLENIHPLGIEMEHTLEQLIEQLGITAEELDDLVAEKGPLDPAISLADAPFWNRAQAGFLTEAVENDGAWAIAADQLDAMFRG